MTGGDQQNQKKDDSEVSLPRWKESKRKKMEGKMCSSYPGLNRSGALAKSGLRITVRPR